MKISWVSIWKIAAEEPLKARRERKCAHVFSGGQMGQRDETGHLDWPCCRCGKLYRFEYGLQAGSIGIITGPWFRARGAGVTPCFYPPRPSIIMLALRKLRLLFLMKRVETCA